MSPQLAHAFLDCFKSITLKRKTNKEEKRGKKMKEKKVWKISKNVKLQCKNFASQINLDDKKLIFLIIFSKSWGEGGGVARA